VLAHGVLSNHTSNHTSTQSLGISLHESSFRMERSGGFSAFESKLVGEREREMKEGGEGVYILPPPKVTVVCFLVEPGSSGVPPDHPGCEQNRQNTEIPRSGSSGIVPDHPTWATMDAHKSPGPDHPARGRIIRTYSESSDTVRPDHPAQGQIIQPSAGTYVVADFCGCFLSRIASHVNHFNNQKFVRMRPS